MNMFHLMSNKTTQTPPSKPSGEAFTSLYPAIVQCFTIILLGYITGRAGWISKGQAKGLNTFTTMFALPALLFSNMATLDWSQVEWMFLGAVFLSKVTFFIISLLITLLIHRPADMGLAALAGIFVTQSNDFALGYPIVQAIYGEKQPQFLQYIYLIAPISLIIINPVGFVLLELQKAKKQTLANRSGCSLLVKVTKEIITNPIIFMTALGVIANFIFSHVLPAVMSDLLNTLGNAFSACALFVLGFNIVGKFKKSMNSVLTGCGLLIFGKLLVFPLMTMGITRALNCGASTNSTTDYYMFGFLYGTFPSAPSVFLYASQYGVGMDLIATALVLCTFLSAPLMFVSAMLFSIQVFSMDYKAVLSETSADISILSLICCIAVLVMFAATKRAARMPHVMVLFIALAQLLWSVGIIIETYTSGALVTGRLQWYEYVKFSLAMIGELGVSSMTAVTAVTMYIISCYSLCRALILRPWLLFYGIGLPLVSISIILIIGNILITPVHGEVMFGKLQPALKVTVLSVNALITVVALVLKQRWNSIHLRERSQYDDTDDSHEEPSVNSAPPDDIEPLSKPINKIRTTSYGSCSSASTSSFSTLSECETSAKVKKGTKSIGPSTQSSSAANFSHIPSIEDIIPFPSRAQTLASVHDERMCSLADSCSIEQRRKCKSLLEKYDVLNTVEEDAIAQPNNVKDSHREYQFGRTTVLLLLLLVSQVINIFFEMWRLLYPETADTNTGVYVEVEFIHAVFNTGQGFLTFAVFGLDVEVILSPMKRKLRKAMTAVKTAFKELFSPSATHQDLNTQLTTRA